MLNISFDHLKRDDDFLLDLGSEIWLMDNHKWALLVWEENRNTFNTSKFSLIHADYHWDGVFDFYDSGDEEQELISANVERIKQFIKEEKLIRYDSFISPAIARGYIAEIHFYCKQNDSSDKGIDRDLLSKMNTYQYIHDTIDSILDHQSKYPVIFDLCLDLFNNSIMYGTGDLWPDDLIINFLNRLKETIKNAQVITISLSFGYSGTEEDTQYLAKLVIPLIKKWRDKSL